jgi:O-antigen/teichoic acid export membrane protein
MKPSSARKIFVNFSFLTIGKVLGDIFIFVLFVVLSRKFGKESIGQYSFAMALTGFFAIFSAFGFYHITIKEINNRIESFSSFFGRVFSSRLILSIIALGVLLLVLPFLPFTAETTFIIALIGVYQLFSRLFDGCLAAFIAHEDMHFAALLDVSFKCAIASAAIIISMNTVRFLLVIGTLPTVSFAFIFLAYYLVKWNYGSPKLTMSLFKLTGIIRKASPYAISAFLMNLYSRFSVVLLGFLLGTVEAGAYNVAYRFIIVIMIIPQLAADSIFPSAARLYLYSIKDFAIFYTRVMNFLIIIGLPAAAGLSLIAPDLVRLIFGQAFAQSALVLRLLAALLFLGSFNPVLGVFLMSCGRAVERMKCHSVTTIFSIFANLILIPAMGIMGAATAAVISEAFLLFLFMITLRDVAGLPMVVSRLIISCIGTASFCLVFAFFSLSSLYLMIPASVLIYTGILALFKQIRNEEIRFVIDSLRKAPTNMKPSV